MSNDNIESVFIEIDKDDIHYDKPVIVVVVYRPPGFDVTTFNEEMNVILSEINNTNKYCYIMGVKSGSATLIDNIFTNTMSDNAY